MACHTPRAFGEGSTDAITVKADPFGDAAMECQADPVARVATWDLPIRPTKHKPIRLIVCAGCDEETTSGCLFFPENYIRWAYYKLQVKFSPNVFQPSGDFCYVCDYLTEHEADTKAKLKDKLTMGSTGFQSDFKATWNETLVPAVRIDVIKMIADGATRLPKRRKREAELKNQTEDRVFVPGTWVDAKLYKAKFSAVDRVHKKRKMISPETGKMVFAHFVPDNVSGLWRGEHGYGDYTAERVVVNDTGDVTDNAVDIHLSKYKRSFGKVVGKTLVAIEADEEAGFLRLWHFTTTFVYHMFAFKF
jgi:hypothetical protein